MPALSPENTEKLLRTFDEIRKVRTIVKLRSRVWGNSVQGGRRVPNIIGKDFLHYWREKFVPSLCKPIGTPVSFLPEKLRDLVQNREHFRAGRRMVRTSPENDAGLSNVMHPSGRVKKCTFSEILNHSYLVDNRFLLLFCLMIGFSVWWAYIPVEAVRSINPLDFHHMEAMKVLVTSHSKVMSDLYLSDTVHEKVLQESLIELYYKVETWRSFHRVYDPLNLPAEIPDLHPSQGTLLGKQSLAVLLGGVILALFLNESVVPCPVFS